jgi:outer membrane protein OmpA-like peptidoglycan-associated protein
MAKSYYKKIKGKNYDRNLIELADKSVSGKGDGRISINDAKKIFSSVRDSNSYTDIEKKTIRYIRDKYKFTKEADKWFRTQIRKWAASKKSTVKKTTKKKKKKFKKDQIYDGYKPMEKLIKPIPDSGDDSRKFINWKISTFFFSFIIIILVIIYFSHDDKASQSEMADNTEKESSLVQIDKDDSIKKDTEPPMEASVLDEDEISSLVIPFNRGGSNFSKYEKPYLDNIITFLKQNPDQKLRIIGHTCNIGDPKKNQILSEHRANSIKKYFILKGISGTRVESIGKGQEEPIVSNETEGGKVKNRRVQFEIFD